MPRPFEPARPRGELWLALGIGLLFVTPISTFVALVAGFDFDPDDYPGSHYLEDIPRRQWAMAVTMAVPALSAVALVASIVVRPWHWLKTPTVMVLVVLAALDFWICWVLGAESVDSARRFAEMF